MNISYNIIKTYDHYLMQNGKNKTLPALFEQFCSLRPVQKKTDKSSENLYLESQNHVGQINKDHPLSASQRVSLSYLFEDNNNLFTIHGPPGTGKTTVILSIIATHLVKATLDKISPPVIIASSSNHNAILNILKDFKLFDRWIPDLEHLGLYLTTVDKSKKKETGNYLYRTRDKESGNLEGYYSEKYLREAKTFFVDKFNNFFNLNETDVLKCQDAIYKNLVNKKKLLDKVILFANKMLKAEIEFNDEFKNIDTFKKYISSLEHSKSDNLSQLSQLKTVHQEWLSYKTNALKWWLIFSWLPFAKKIIQDKILLFTLKFDYIFNEQIDNIDKIEETINKKQINLKNAINEINKKLINLQRIEDNLNTRNLHKLELEKELGFEIKTENLYDFEDKESLLSKLDITLRYDMFLLATHYWEAEWILKSSKRANLDYSIEGRKAFWQLQMMLTPCAVCTLHSGPSFFNYRNSSEEFVPVNNFIDVLIIDEAGQVMPSYAGPMISMSKKGIFVGDIHQIEPVFNLTPGIDFANTKKFGLCNSYDEYKSLIKKGILCSGDIYINRAYGNLVTLGQNKAIHQLKDAKQTGMLLLEHRRCPREIISFCNELSYDNQLKPMTIETECDFPRFGYAHIKGITERKGSSRCNYHEAETIGEWLVKNKNKILKNTKKSTLNECVGIITPFGAQGDLIRSALDKRKLGIEMTGTIHSLQGAEKEIIIFSPVYTAQDGNKSFFFDKTNNMLNVAVSRAKMSFLVFGDMDIFDPEIGNKPSSLLAKYLFAKENNELVDVFQPKYFSLGRNDIEQITTLARHREVLKSSFGRTIKELNIVSPYLRSSAIEEDGIDTLIKEYSKKIQINIYVDPTLNGGTAFKDFINTEELLRTSGATIFRKNNVHSKIIAIDESIIIEGSFNWLSAPRRKDGMYQREECSILYAGDKVSEFIDEALSPIINK